MLFQELVCAPQTPVHKHMGSQHQPANWQGGGKTCHAACEWQFICTNMYHQYITNKLLQSFSWLDSVHDAMVELSLQGVAGNKKQNQLLLILSSHLLPCCKFMCIFVSLQISNCNFHQWFYWVFGLRIETSGHRDQLWILKNISYCSDKFVQFFSDSRLAPRHWKRTRRLLPLCPSPQLK